MPAFTIVANIRMGAAAFNASRAWRRIQKSPVTGVPMRGVNERWRGLLATAPKEALGPINMGRTIKATGWLRAPSFGSSTASFEIDLSAEPVCGRVRSEMTMIVEAMAAGRATLVTESGRSIAIRPVRRTEDSLHFTVAGCGDDVERYLES